LRALQPLWLLSAHSQLANTPNTRGRGSGGSAALDRVVGLPESCALGTGRTPKLQVGDWKSGGSVVLRGQRDWNAQRASGRRDLLYRPSTVLDRRIRNGVVLRNPHVLASRVFCHTMDRHLHCQANPALPIKAVSLDANAAACAWADSAAFRILIPPRNCSAFLCRRRGSAVAHGGQSC
jgi:hypothetical protein